MRCFFAYRETLLRKRLFVSTLGSWTRLVTLGLGLADLGHGLSVGIAKIATAPDMKAEAVKDAVVLTQAIAQEAATPQAGQSAQIQQPAPSPVSNNP